MTCRNPLSLISPRPSAPSPSLSPLLSRHSPSLHPRHTHACMETHSQKHTRSQMHINISARTHVLYICAAFIRLGLDVCWCPVVSLQSNPRSPEQISVPRSPHHGPCVFRCLCCISCWSWYLKIDLMCLYICAEIVSLCLFFWDNPIHC